MHASWFTLSMISNDWNVDVETWFDENKEYLYINGNKLEKEMMEHENVLVVQDLFL